MTVSTTLVFADGAKPGSPNTDIKDTTVVKCNRYIAIDALQKLIN